MGRVIFITSFKGGAGKTTVTANIAGALTSLKKRVLVVDGDFGMRCMDIVLGFEDRTVFDIGDVLAGRCDVVSALASDESNPFLFFLAAPLGEEPSVSEPELYAKKAQSSEQDDKKQSEIVCGVSGITETDISESADSLPDKTEQKVIRRGEYIKLIGSLRDKYDYILIDSAANVNEAYIGFAKSADEAIVVSLHQASSIRAAERTALALGELGLKEQRIVINCFNTNAAKKKQLPGVVDIIEKTSVKLLGVIPYDPALPVEQEAGRIAFSAQRKKRFLYEIAAMNITNRLIGNNIPLFTGIYDQNKKTKLF